MIPFEKASEIFSQRWLIEHNYVLSQIPLLYAFMQGQQINAETIINGHKPYIVKGDADINTCDRWDLEYGEVPVGSVLVIPVDGPIMSWTAMNIMRYMAQAEKNDNVSAVLFLVNSPGGVVFQTDVLAGNIKNFSKPVVTYVVGMMCSAATWLFSGSKRIFASSKMDIFGSVGVMTGYEDYSGMFEKLGIKEFTFYATKSTEKNQPIRTLLDPEATEEEKLQRKKELIANIDFINDLFHADIQANLGIAKDSPVFTGKTFHTEEALQIGLLHELNTLQYAIEYAHHEGLVAQINNYSLIKTRK